MKKYIIQSFMLSLFFLTSSCKKELENTIIYDYKLLGTWVYQEKYFGSIKVSNDSVSNFTIRDSIKKVEILEFNNNSTANLSLFEYYKISSNNYILVNGRSNNFLTITNGNKFVQKGKAAPEEYPNSNFYNYFVIDDKFNTYGTVVYQISNDSLVTYEHFTENNILVDSWLNFPNSIWKKKIFRKK